MQQALNKHATGKANSAPNYIKAEYDKEFAEAWDDSRVYQKTVQQQQRNLWFSAGDKQSAPPIVSQARSHRARQEAYVNYTSKSRQAVQQANSSSQARHESGWVQGWSDAKQFGSGVLDDCSNYG